MAGKSYVRLHRDLVENTLKRESRFSKELVEKALCSTGHKDEETTYVWLRSHASDPSLQQPVDREYIIFLCPTGPLLEEVSKFYEASFNKCGANSAHNLFPHITLSSFFKVKDSTVPSLLDILRHTVQSCTSGQPIKLNLSLQRSEGYIGLFLTENAYSWISEVLNIFVRRVNAELGITIKPQDRQFHLTLAYNFDLSKTEELEFLARKVNIDAPARWELNIYSRDPRFNGKQFQLVLYEFKASEPDELDLQINAHVVMESDTSRHKGWKKGIDFTTGKSGYFPENFTKKTAEWRLWTKNISLSVTHTSDKHARGLLEERTNHKPPRRTQSVNLKKEKKEQLRSSLRVARPHNDKPKVEKRHSSSSSSSTWEPVIRTSTAINPKVAHHVRQRSLESAKPLGVSDKSSSVAIDSNNATISSRQAVDESNKSNNKGVEKRRIFLMRHAERVDLTFGHDWFNLYIDEKGYHRRNLNLPRRIPTRRGGPKDFYMDGPISEIGTFQAKLIGEAFRAKSVSFTAVYSSPSLRSIQTTTALLEGLMDSDTTIKIEPALFEWMAWCRNTLPKFMLPDELSEYGFNIDMGYIAHFPFSQFNLHEKMEEYYYRSHSFVESTLRNATGNILMVGHASTLDICSRQLTGHPIRKTDDLIRVVQKVPFCGLCTVEEQGYKQWSLVQAPIPSLAHGQNQTFDWRILESTAPAHPYGR